MGEPEGCARRLDVILPRMANPSRPTEWAIPPESDGERLDRFLAQQLPQWSRSKLQSFVKEGLVELDGVELKKPGTTLPAGSVLRATLPPRRVAATADQVKRQLDVIFEDDDILVVNKPAGLLSHGLDSGQEVSLAEVANAYCGPLPSPQGEDRPGIVHRLDRETSGVMVLGKNEKSLAELMRQFKDREVEKTYSVLVRGEPRFASDWIDTPLGRDPRSPDRMAVVDADEGGRAASTLYEVQERLGGFTHLHCHPKTGRTHQIRVHMQSIELEVMGDRVYRVRNKNLTKVPDDAPKFHRQMLHARKLELKHPETGEALAFEAPLAEDMQTLLTWLQAR
jgi:23S rRNA pseudouridine1911/1915/1917 synthase